MSSSSSTAMGLGFAFFVGLLMVFIGAVIVYDGEREVNGQTVDCIGFFDEKPNLPEGWAWKTEANPLVPSFFIYAPIGPIVTVLTDAVCPAEVANVD